MLKLVVRVWAALIMLAALGGLSACSSHMDPIANGGDAPGDIAN
ncbi:MAG: hypothetical protein U1E17_13985 [Geminicoccaceae bacterium]